MEPARITIKDVKKRMDRGEKVLFIDTRGPDSWDSSDVKITGAVRMHYSDIEQRLNELPRDRLIVTYCT